MTRGRSLSLRLIWGWRCSREPAGLRHGRCLVRFGPENQMAVQRELEIGPLSLLAVTIFRSREGVASLVVDDGDFTVLMF